MFRKAMLEAIPTGIVGVALTALSAWQLHRIWDLWGSNVDDLESGAVGDVITSADVVVLAGSLVAGLVGIALIGTVVARRVSARTRFNDSLR